MPVLSEKEKGNVYQVFYIGYFIGNGREKEKLYRMYFIIPCGFGKKLYYILIYFHIEYKLAINIFLI